jgi:beta-glucanase (GH16 family)
VAADGVSHLDSTKWVVVTNREGEHPSREVETRQAYLYGRFEVRMRAPRGRRAVAVFMAYRPSPFDAIAVQIAGSSTRTARTDLLASPTEVPTEVAPFPTEHPLGFDAAQDYHIYAFEWEPTEVRWYVDGVLLDRSNNPGTIPTLPLRVSLRIGAKGRQEVDATYDWVRVYTRTP